MQCDGSCAFFLADATRVEVGKQGVIDAFAELDCDRHVTSASDDTSHNLTQQSWFDRDC